MADYHHQSDRGPPPQRPREYGNPSVNQREAAFSNIFGSAPPRSHTMTSATPPPLMNPEGRTHTMSSTYSSMTGHGPEHGRPPPPRPPHPSQYQEHPQRMHHQEQMATGYYPGPRSASGGHQVPSPHALQYMQQRRHPPPGPGPPRFDSRGGPGGPGGPPQAYAPRPMPVQRYPQGSGPMPAMNGDPYRSQSLASGSRPMYHQPPTGHPPPNPRYNAYNPNFARTTAQGRIVPDRGDERSMSMTGHHPQDRDSHQTMSGRVIPNRRFPSDSHGNSGYQSYNPGSGSGSGSGYAPPGSQTRTASMASSTGNDSGRAMSMASTIAPTITTYSEADTVVATTPTSSNQSRHQHQRSSASAAKSFDSERPPTAKIRPPLVYPALLSRVGECFRRKIPVSDRTKNGLTYKNAFSGAEAVDVLSYIIRTTDRNLALLLGRSLDAQKFFHDVTYEHRLRDSPSELYQFRETLMEDPEDKPAVNGVFVLLSECYSPTCTRDQLCYSIACPRRLEQVSRLNLKMGPGLKKESSSAAEDDADQTDEQKLWINSVPKEIVDSVDEREMKRQEVISEICYTERDFVKDLEYLRDFWIMPLLSKVSPLPIARRDKVVSLIFTNIIDSPSLHGVSARFAKSLTERQQKSPVVRNIGDIFLDFVPHFEPFIHYGARQLEAKFEFENERSCNAYFAKFVDEIERRKESRKLELNGYLTKPTTRLARYPLLLENVLKYTEADNPDKEDIPKVLTMIRALLNRVNTESGKAENRFNLRRLHEQLKFRPNEKVDLRLTDYNREMVFKSVFKKSPTDPQEITAFLFDHAVLLVRVKKAGKNEEIKAYRRPIPLELLDIREMEEVIPSQGAVKRSSSSLIPSIRATTGDAKKGEGWPITFRHLGKNGYELTLYAMNQAARKKWLEKIDNSQTKLRSRANFFNTSCITDSFFTATNHVNCAAPFDGSRKLLVGTDSGIYVLDRRAKGAAPKRVIDVTNVTQVEVLEEYQLFIVLSNKSLLSYSLSALDPNEPALSRRPKKIQSHCNFFKAGICLGRHLVCAVRSSGLSTRIQVYEPNDAMAKTKKQKGLGKMFGGQDELRPFKEFYIPAESSSVHFLKSKLCVACSKGFEVLSLETLEAQSLLDQADTSLDFVARREGVKPIHIERLDGEFLVNYSEFSFFVNRHGWRAKPEWRIDWEGTPQNFALSYPWLLAFETNFIELRDIESGAVHIVPHKNIRMLHSSTNEIIFAYEDERGEDVIESIDFWKTSSRRPELLAPASP